MWKLEENYTVWDGNTKVDKSVSLETKYSSSMMLLIFQCFDITITINNCEEFNVSSYIKFNLNSHYLYFKYS